MPLRVFAMVGMVLLLHLFHPSVSAGQTTALVLKSQPGDYIGGGLDQTFGTADGTFTVFRNFNNGVAISFNGGPHWWNLNFAAPNNAQLVPGVYLDATRWPFQSPTAPGLDVSGEGRGCNTLIGRFEVLEAVYTPAGDIERFAATFEQHCEGMTPALLGSVLYNSTLPPPPPPPTTCISEIATLSALADAVNLLPTSGQTRNVLMELLIAAQTSRDNNRPRVARSLMAQFISSTVQASNLLPRNRNSIPTTDANALVCSASNVMTNITVP